ncbi:MAG: MoaD family protein [Deltaproteobacteria bacterium]|nr:MoaD family protein [Deltaproteobacteria bacterium]
MGIRVRLAAPLRAVQNQPEAVELDGNTVKEVLSNLTANTTGIREKLFDDNGKLRRFINIYLNNEDIRFMNGLDTPVKPGDEISIVPAVAGG